MKKNNATLVPLICVWVSALMVGCVSTDMDAHAASFDCAKADTKVEHMVCDNPEISKLDEDLSVAYKEALKDQTQAVSIKQEQRKWLKERNGCVDVECVIATYHARIDVLSASNILAGNEPPFSLLKGKGLSVCDAYLERLNATEWGAYEKLPTCGRPESDSVEEFMKLNRVPLTAEQISNLWSGVFNFVYSGNSGKGNDFIRATPSTYKPIQEVQDSIKNGGLKVWRYKPPVDIDNDGKPDDDVIVWQGGTRQGICGRHAGPSNTINIHQAYVFSVDWQTLELNEARTRELTEHPVGGYPTTTTNGMFGGFYRDYRPIGREMEIFAYQGQYYFDTFFDGWGDFEGKRRADWGNGKRRVKNSLADILGVFQRKDDATKQICEYRWNEFEQYYR